MRFVLTRNPLEMLCLPKNKCGKKKRMKTMTDLKASDKKMLNSMGTCTHTNICTYIPTYLHTYIPTYIPTYLHTYIHTYIHTYMFCDVVFRGMRIMEKMHVADQQPHVAVQQMHVE